MALSSIGPVLAAQGLLPESSRITAAQLYTAEALRGEETARQQEILLARRYHEGKGDVFLPDRLKQWLEVDSLSRKPDFLLNLARKVVEAPVEKLRFEGVDAAKIVLDKDKFVTDVLKIRNAATQDSGVAEPEPISPDAIEARRQLAWVGYWMSDANLGLAIDEAFEMAVRDGEAFLFVFPNEKNGMFPKVIAQPRFTSSAVTSGEGANLVSGDDYGCKMHYPNGDHRLDPEFASKQWVEYVGHGLMQRRMNLYFEDRIEFYVAEVTAQVWEPYRDPDNDGATSIPWTADDEPLGIPIVHLKKSDLRPQALDAIPMQDAIVKVLVDLLAAADLTAFQIIITRGWFPTTDGNPPDDTNSNLLNIAPGYAIGTGAKANETATDVIKAADLSPLLDLLRTLILYLAIICNLPTSRFNFSGSVASEETLKEQDEPLLSAARRLQKPFGDALEEMFTVARRMANAFGEMQFDEEVSFRAMWGKGETRSTMDLLQELAIKREKLHLPFRQLWIEAGYTEAQVDNFLADPEIRAFLQALEQTMLAAANPQPGANGSGANASQNKNAPRTPGGTPGQGRAAAQNQTVNTIRNQTVRRGGA